MARGARHEGRGPAPGSPLADARFAALYAAHRAAVVRYLRRRLGDDAAEDAAAEVFTRAFRRLGSLEGTTADALPWLYGFAANVVRERWRAERRRLRLLERLAATAPRSIDAGADGVAGLDPALVRGLRTLSRDDRETLLLLVWGELSYDEVALALDVPVGTVRSRIARVRRQLEPLHSELTGLAATGGADA